MVRRKRAKRLFLSSKTGSVQTGWMGAHPAAQPMANWRTKNMWYLRKTRGGRG